MEGGCGSTKVVLIFYFLFHSFIHSVRKKIQKLARDFVASIDTSCEDDETYGFFFFSFLSFPFFTLFLIFSLKNHQMNSSTLFVLLYFVIFNHMASKTILVGKDPS